jgi:hypothetical protein
MRFRHIWVLVLLFIAAPALLADGTISYTSTVTYGPLVKALEATAKTPLEIPALKPATRTAHLKNGKMQQDGGMFTAIYDSKTMQFTFMDPKRKLYAVTNLSDLLQQLFAPLATPPPAPPPQMQMILQSMKTTFAFKKTGRTGLTLGLQTEETELTLALSMSLPPGILPPAADATAQPAAPVTILKVVVHVWKPTPAELARVPALSEMANFWSDQTAMTTQLTAGATSAMRRLLGDNSGFGDASSAMIAESLKDRTPMLRCDIEMYAPVVAELAPILKARGVASVDPDAAVLEYTTEAVEVSSAPIDDSVFAVPSDYKSAPLAGVLRPAPPGGADAGRMRVPPAPGAPGEPTPQELRRIPFL